MNFLWEELGEKGLQQEKLPRQIVGWWSMFGIFSFYLIIKSIKVHQVAKNHP